MSKIKKLKIKQNDGTWVEQELGANAQNIDYSNITLEEALNNIELTKTGSTIKLTKPNGTQNSIIDKDTTYTLIKDDIDNDIMLKDNNGTIISTITDSDSFFKMITLSEFNIDNVTTPGIYYLNNCYYDSDNKTFGDSTSIMMVFGDNKNCIQLRFAPNDNYIGNSRRLTNWTEMKWSHWRGYVTFGGDGTNKINQKLECTQSVEGVNLVSTGQGIEIYGKPIAFIDFHYNNNELDFTQRISVSDNVWLKMSNPVLLDTRDSIIGSAYGNPIGFVNGNNSANVPITCSNVNQTSSIRYKNNIENITEEQANRILDIATKMFNYKISNEIERKHFGVIAEELIKIFPDLVYTKKIDDEEVPDSVDYIGLIAPLIKKIQMQQEEINQIKKELNLN